VPPPPRRWFFRFRVREIEGALPAVVAAVIPLRQGDLGFFVHFLPAVAEMLGGDGLDRGPDPAEPPAPAEAPLAGLTRREREILRLLAAGKTAKPIAAELGLSVPTVRTHIQHILRKLDVHSSLEAAVRFLRTAAP
jgi:DNA-binding NarL/FixJ family response regulator